MAPKNPEPSWDPNPNPPEWLKPALPLAPETIAIDLKPGNPTPPAK
jgi:hypothetical protein